MTLRKSTLTFWALVALYFLVIASGLKTFTVWSQITAIVGEDPAHLLVTGHVHALRFVVMYPVIWLADTFTLDADRVFSFTIFGAFVTIGVLLSKACALILRGTTVDWRAFFPGLFGFFAVLSWFMNGRIALAMLGLTIILFAQVKWQVGAGRSLLGFLISCGVGQALMGVSTGTFLVGVFVMISFTVILPLTQWPNLRRSDLAMLIIGLGVVIGVTPMTLGAVSKNLDFYGGGFQGLMRMLSHGAGGALPTDVPLLGGLAIAGLVLGMLYLARARLAFRQRSSIVPVEIASLSILLLGPFGFSTMFASLPALALFARVHLNRSTM